MICNPAHEKSKPLKRLVFRINQKYAGKAGIFIETGVVIFDRDFVENASELTRIFVILHEIGHHFYYTESKADIFAVNALLVMRYERNDIKECIKNSLRSNQRKAVLMTYIDWTENPSKKININKLILQKYAVTK